MTTQNNTSNNNQKSTLTMSSREIAKLTGKRHDHALRDVDKLLKTLSPELGTGFSMTYEGDPTNGYRYYILDRDSTYCLMAGYDANARMRIIKRWQELEEEKKKKPKLEELVNRMKREEVQLLGFKQMSLNTRKAMKSVQWELQGLLGLREKSQAYRRIKMREPLNLLINGMSSGELRRQIGIRRFHRDCDNRPMKTCDFLPLPNQYALYRTDLSLMQYLILRDFDVLYGDACDMYLRYGDMAKIEAERMYDVDLHNFVEDTLRDTLAYVEEQARLDISPYAEVQRQIKCTQRSVIKRR